MAGINDFIKADKVVRTALGLLEREVALPNLIWQDAAVADVRLAKGDTITVKLPAYFKSKKRALRSGAARTKSALHQRAIDVTLTTDIYGDIPITDEELTLDIEDFGADVLLPVLRGIARGLEEEIADVITGATYANTVQIDDQNWKATVAEAREKLNKAEVPQSQRTLLVGSEIDAQLIQMDNFVRYDQSNSTSALRDATIGRFYGFDVVTSNLIAPDEAYAFHKTAYVMTHRAPVVPAGAPWGATHSSGGFAVRTVRVFDPDEVEDRFIADSWIGANVVTDAGALDLDGRFEPSEDPDGSNSDDLLVRAVKLTSSSSGA